MAFLIIALPALNVKRGFPNLWSLTFFMDKQFLTRNLKILWAAHHFVFKSKDTEAIADVVNVKPSKVKHWMQSYEWLETLAYWRGNATPIQGDLGLAENLWAEMVQNSEDLNPVDYPDKAIKSPPDNPDVYALIQSHLFCVDNLCDDEMRARLAKERQFESNPVRYEGQALESPYHWWLYPNYTDGVYSKVFARANVVGDLVIGTGDDTCLVCIRHGRLTLTRQVSDDVVSTSDKRLLVCL